MSTNEESESKPASPIEVKLGDKKNQEEDQNGSFWRQVKLITLELCQNATCHGLSYVLIKLDLIKVVCFNKRYT